MDVALSTPQLHLDDPLTAPIRLRPPTTLHLEAVKVKLQAVEEPVEWRAALELPPDAAPTFMADSNSLRWSVHVHLAIPGWPDWVQQFPIIVRP